MWSFTFCTWENKWCLPALGSHVILFYLRICSFQTWFMLILQENFYFLYSKSELKKKKILFAKRNLKISTVIFYRKIHRIFLYHKNFIHNFNFKQKLFLQKILCCLLTTLLLNKMLSRTLKCTLRKKNILLRKFS